MAIGFILLKQIIAMICMVAAGAILCKCKLVDGEQSRTLSQVTLYLCSPCVLFSAFQTTFTPDKAKGLLIVALGAAVTLVLFVVLGEALMRRKKPLAPSESCCVMFCNAGNLIIPIVQGIWGTEYVIYLAPYLMLQIILLWSYGVRLMGGQRKPFLQTMLQPNIVAVLLGAVTFVTNIRLPGPIQQGISLLGNCVGPLSMVIIGILLAETPLRSLVRDKRILRTAVLRLIVFPLVAVAVLAVLGFFWREGDLHTILMVSLLCSLGPSASNLTAIAQTLRHPEAKLVSAINVLSVILCAVTMPLHCMLLQAIYNIF